MRSPPRRRSGGRSAPPSGSALRAADLKPHAPARRMPSLEPIPAGTRRHPAVAIARRAALAAVSLGGILLAVLALNKIGLDNITNALINSSPSYVLLGLAVMCGAMVMRGVLLARDPARRDADGPGQAGRRDAGNLHRGADVLDAPRPPG